MHIGVFDSGIGGLTVLKAIRTQWPGHSTTYLGDTARVPYGAKSGETVARYALQNARFLLAQGVELLVVACNTASAHAPAALVDLPIPWVGMIETGARCAVEAGRDRIGVIATAGAVASGAYERAIRLLRPGAAVDSIPCPMFVPLVEEGWQDDPIAEQIVRRYLGAWTPGGEARPEVVVLGCTHYPLLKPMLVRVLGADVTLIDSAEAASASLAGRLDGAPGEARPVHRICLTDAAPGFVAIAQRILGALDCELERVDINFAEHAAGPIPTA